MPYANYSKCKEKIIHHFYLYLLQYCISISYRLYIFFFLCNISKKTLKHFLVENQFFKILTLKFCLVKHPAPNQEDITSL